MSNAKYLADQIIKGEENGGLPYRVVVPDSYWSKYQNEVDEILIERGYENLIVKDLQK
ncbi:hypothetical protein C671_1220 [[Clostridium] bifermentans ATCC 19299]|uniref:hypothetical protein n=1 Tax=Paraclostridium bifermentans TaxID=1490 RepID=UPI00038C8569|nr:hypothetical protein [Paraclostridium bifermentans]EQK47121.1 hypothetical protein C671_1220 [[Clostridium] bifermentans ATCC 19299] [Paraclostridium bifermentans ATCC 19299]